MKRQRIRRRTRPSRRSAELQRRAAIGGRATRGSAPSLGTVRGEKSTGRRTPCPDRAGRGVFRPLQWKRRGRRKPSHPRLQPLKQLGRQPKSLARPTVMSPARKPRPPARLSIPWHRPEQLLPRRQRPRRHLPRCRRSEPWRLLRRRLRSRRPGRPLPRSSTQPRPGRPQMIGTRTSPRCCDENRASQAPRKRRRVRPRLWRGGSCRLPSRPAQTLASHPMRRPPPAAGRSHRRAVCCHRRLAVATLESLDAPGSCHRDQRWTATSTESLALPGKRRGSSVRRARGHRPRLPEQGRPVVRD